MSNDLVATATQAVNTNPEDDATGSLEHQFLTFNLAEETYGIDILKVQEIRGWSQVTQIPNAPEHIRGVMNLRGAIVPIIDLRRRFGMEEVDFTQYTVVIVVNFGTRTIGMVVDSVSDVVNLPAEAMRPAPDFGTSIDSSFIHRLASTEERMIILLDIAKLLSGCSVVDEDALSEMAASADAEPASA